MLGIATLFAAWALVGNFSSAQASPPPAPPEGSVQRPSALRTETSNEATDEATDPTSSPPSGTGVVTPVDPPTATVPDLGETKPSDSSPEIPPNSPETASGPAPSPGATTDGNAPAGPSTTAISPDLLAGDEDPATKPAAKPSTPITAEDEGSREAAIAVAYADLYRPASNPARLNLVARAMFANAGGKGDVGGRLGGVQIDIGHAWNRVGYGITVSAWGGSVVLQDRTAEMNAILGLGPTLSLGRLSLLGRGYLDLRVGYDFTYGIVNRRRDDAVVAMPAGSDVELEQADNLLPHGPRVQLNMGLLSAAPQKRIHGFGVTVGYQALVGSFRGELPFTHLLSVGISYWLG